MDAGDKEFLTSLYWAAVDAADPLKVLPTYLPAKPKGKTIVIGAGKGAAHMARAFEALWDGPFEGTVVTRHGFAVGCETIKVIEAAHPVPDHFGEAAVGELFALIDGLSEDDLVIALICGGGSALLPAPPNGFGLEDEIALNKALLASGAPISAMNAIRKQFSQVKGGRLAAATQARVVSLVVSDVPGDDPAQVASGPTVPDAVNRADALGFIERYNIALPGNILAHIQAAEEAPIPGDAVFAGNETHVISSAALSLKAAGALAEKAGYTVDILSDRLEGEARDEGAKMATFAKERMDGTPRLLLSGGECTVTIKNKGKGGPNGEFALAFALGIDGAESVSLLAADTDGIDGSEDNAGAFVDGQTIAAMKAQNIDADERLERNDSWTAFDAIDALYAPGPTGTNVNDFRAVLLKN